MSIDTEIEGKPGTLQTLATWLTGDLATGLDDAADEAARARSVGSSWGGDAGSAFDTRTRTASERIEELAADAKAAGRQIGDFADELKICQDDMRDLRERARGADLSVSGFVVADPGPGPDRPPSAPMLFSDAQATAHESAVRAYDAHQAKIEAYNDCVTEHDRVRRRHHTACTALQDMVTARTHVSNGLNVGAILGSTAAAHQLDRYRGRLSAQLPHLRTLEERALRRMANSPKVGSPEWDQAKRDWERATRNTADTTRGLDSADQRMTKTKLAGKALGPLATGFGIYSDMQDGESATQAVVSQGGGALAAFGAGAAAGAVVGSFIPVPVVGTAAGALVGGVAGLFASGAVDGAIDAVWDDGLGAAAGGAWDGLKGTAGGLKDGATGLVKGIGGLFG